MIDKLSLTIVNYPDKNYLEEHGDISEDPYRKKLYKYMCDLDNMVVFYCPHKFKEKANARIPYTKIDINPKYFVSYYSMFASLLQIFDSPYLNQNDFNVSRMDIAVDMEDFSIDALLSTMRISKIRVESLSFYKGTIYAGSNPKVRIYDKVKEIKRRDKKDSELTDYEKGLLDSGDSYTRFEIQIRNVKKTLGEVVDGPEVFASYFDRLEFFDFPDNNGSGILQVLYKYINRKFRRELEKYKNHDIVPGLKERYIASVGEWLSDKDPF